MSESQKKSFQIKVLPKKSAVSAPPEPPPSRGPKKKKKSRPKPPSPPYKGLVFGMIAIGILGLMWNLSAPKSKDSTTINPGTNESAADKRLNRFLQDGQKKHELKQLGVSIENTNLPKDAMPAFLPLDSEGEERRALGVELEQDPAIENVYKDLYGESRGSSFQTPEERISARLAEKKWVNTFENEEKKTFIRNFIASAREAGYEIELNDDLIVTKVKPITSRPKISLEKVIENMNNR